MRTRIHNKSYLEMPSSSESDDVVICRTCINECNDYKSLFKQGIILGELTTLAKVLTYCTNLECGSEESMPQYICSMCVGRLAKSYVFKKAVLEADELLRKPRMPSSVDEEIEMVDIDQTYVSEMDAEELQDLSSVEQIKQELEGVEYVTLTVIDESAEGDSTEMTEEHKEQCWSGNEEKEYVFQSEEDVVGIEVVENRTEDEEEGNEIEDDANVKLDGHVVEEIVDSYNELSDDQEVLVRNDMYEIVRVDDKYNEEENDDSDTTSKSQKTTRLRIEINPKNDHCGNEGFKTRNSAAHGKIPDPDFQCQICGKQLSNPNSLKYHLQLHSDATPFLCSLCGEGFKTRNAYEGHIILHDPNNPNTCQLCGKTYRQSSSLRTHMLSHTGEKPYQCDICGKGMTQKSGYKKHMLIHSGEKPHTCDVCGRHFRYSSNLIAHRRCHSIDKPYSCPQCEKCFHTMEQRKRHMLVHTGEKPYPCEACGKTFKRRSSLSAHRHTHTHANDKRAELIEQKVSKSNVVELY